MDIAKLLGQIAGGAIGTAVAPGIGTSMGANIGGSIGSSIGGGGHSDGGSKQAQMGIGEGALQLLQASQKRKEADSAFPQWYDPQQMAFLSELGQKRKAMETGAEFASGINAINSSMAGTNAGIAQAGAGNVAGTIQGLLQSQRIGQDQINQVLANGQAQGLQYNNMYRELLDKVSARKMQLQLAKSQQARAEWAQKAKEGTANLMGGLSYLNTGGGSGVGSSGGFNPMDLLSKIGAGANSVPGTPTSTTGGGDISAGIEALNGGGGLGEASLGGIMGG